MAIAVEQRAPGSVAARPARAAAIDARALARELTGVVRGEVRFSAGSRALYANDASVYRQLPIGVVIPRSAEDVVAAIEVCRRHRAPICARGCGTGLAGQTVNEAVMFDFSKYMREIVELDPGARRARVQPGVVLDWLRDAAEEHDLTFGPDPATHTRCTFGGMIGNNSCGTHSILAGVTADNILALEVLLYDGTRLTVPSRVDEQEIHAVIARDGREGEIYAGLLDLRERYADAIRERFPQIPRRISGYNLDRLLPEHGFNLAAALVGTEATCALTLEATCKLIDSPQHRALVLLGYEDSPTAADRVPEVMEFEPIALETFDQKLVDNELVKGFPERPELLPGGRAWLLVEFGADSSEDAEAQAERFMDAMRKQDGPHQDIKLYEERDEIAAVWKIREGGVGHSKVPNEHPGWPSWEDAAVAPERTGDYLRDLQKLCDKHGRRIAAFFGHVGHGCMHTRIDWDFLTPEGVANYRAFMEDAGDLIAAYGGSLSGEHGDGQARAELLPQMFGDELVRAFREFKEIWDPDWMMNPGKVVDPYPLDTNLRMDPSYEAPVPATHFQFPDDRGSFVEAAQRCFGVGVCRDQEDTMCPSYMATMEEKHSTRGRARLLFELMRADSPLKGGWRNEEVKEALDLCLACKGCKHDCPVRVDMATYKAEFRSHYWARRLRPLHAYALGLVYWESRLAARAPRLANLLSQTEPLATLGKRAVGLTPHRQAPPFASTTFTAWFARQQPRGGVTRVVLWPDTFTNHFEPEIAIAATEVLQDAGYEVVVPGRSLCCGRPLYDYGMLALARRQLRQILDSLRDEIRRGTPVLALEPSCGAVFRDELPNMLPNDQDAKRLARLTCSLGELLDRRGERWEAPALRRHALVHAHCHQKATADTAADLRVLDRLGVSYEALNAGCCGLAGSFGYEDGQPYEVSMKAGERVLLPAVRAASPDTLVVTDGFSCRHQISHGTDRTALHLAQVVQMALRHGPGGPNLGTPEQAYAHADGTSRRRAPALLGLAAGAAGAAAVAVRRARSNSTRSRRVPHPIRALRGRLAPSLRARLGGRDRTRVIVLFACVLGLETADLASLGAIAGQLKPALHLHNTQIGVLAAAPALVAAAATLPLGIVADRWPRTPLLALSTATWAVAMALSGAASSFVMLLVVRLFLGATTAASAPLVASLVGDLFEPRERGRVWGYILAGQLLGSGFGLLVIGNVAALSWRVGLWVLALPSVAVALAIRRLLSEPARGGAGRLRHESREAGRRRGAQGSRPSARRRDAEEPGAGTPRRATAVARAARRAGVRPRRELVLRGDPVAMPVWGAVTYVLRVPTNVILIVASALGYFFQAGVNTFGVVFVIAHFGVSQSAATSLLALVAVGGLVGVVLGGRLADALLARGWLPARMVIGGGAFVLSSAIFVPGLLTRDLAVAMLLYLFAAAALAAPGAPLDAARLDVMPARLWGRAEAVRTVLRTLAIAVAPLVFGFVSDELSAGPRATTKGVAYHASGPGLKYAFLLMLIPMTLGGLVLVRGARSYCRDVATALASEKNIGRARHADGGQRPSAEASRSLSASAQPS